MNLQTKLSFGDVLVKPQKGIVDSRSEIDLSTKLTENIELDLPILAAPMGTVVNEDVTKIMANKGGRAVLHRFQSIEDQVEQANKSYTEKFGVAVGLKDWEERIGTFEENNPAEFYMLDVAHGHQEQVIEAVKQIKETFDIELIVGSIATEEAAKDLIIAGADGLRCGVGVGSACSTRVVTGAGVPQISAIHEVYEATRQFSRDVPVIADGGIQTSGDICKALLAGASSVMTGGLIAGTDEAPSMYLIKSKEGKNVTLSKSKNPLTDATKIVGKKYKGMSSKSAKDQENNKLAPEGVEGVVEYRGGLAHLLRSLELGIKSGISYGGGDSISSFKEKAKFQRVTPATQELNSPHHIQKPKDL